MSRRVNVLALTTGESTRYIRGDDRGSSAGVPERDQIVLAARAARHEQVHRWVPLDILDVPSVASKDLFLSTLCERPNLRGRVVSDRGIVRCLARSCPCTASGCTDHAVRFFILGRKYLMIPDWSAGVMYANARIAISYAWSPEDSFQIERQYVPGRELPTRGTGRGPLASTRCDIGRVKN